MDKKDLRVEAGEGENPYLEGKAVKELSLKQLDLARAYERGQIDLKAQGYVKLPTKDEFDSYCGKWYLGDGTMLHPYEWLKQKIGECQKPDWKEMPFCWLADFQDDTDNAERVRRLQRNADIEYAEAQCQKCRGEA